MINEKSCGAIIVRKTKYKFLFLLLKYSKRNNYWGLAKGHVHQGETEIETAKREICEETGITDSFFAPDFRVTTSYSPAPDIVKLVVFFLAITEQEIAQSLCGEHNDFIWLDYADAIIKLTYDNDKEVLHKAHHYIANQFR